MLLCLLLLELDDAELERARFNPLCTFNSIQHSGIALLRACSLDSAFGKDPVNDRRTVIKPNQRLREAVGLTDKQTHIDGEPEIRRGRDALVLLFTRGCCSPCTVMLTEIFTNKGCACVFKAHEQSQW